MSHRRELTALSWLSSVMPMMKKRLKGKHGCCSISTPTWHPSRWRYCHLSRRENLVSLAKEVYTDLRQCWMVQYDDAQSIGRRYRRQDEIGTPFCVTVDFQSLEDKQVTIRERDSLNQIRVPIAELRRTLQAKLDGEDLFVLPPGGKIWKRREKMGKFPEPKEGTVFYDDRKSIRLVLRLSSKVHEPYDCGSGKNEVKDLVSLLSSDRLSNLNECIKIEYVMPFSRYTRQIKV